MMNGKQKALLKRLVELHADLEEWAEGEKRCTSASDGWRMSNLTNVARVLEYMQHEIDRFKRL